MELLVSPKDPTKCDKCGGQVALENDATQLRAEYIESESPVGAALLGLFGVARHLFPVLEGEQVVCEESPSVAQYLEGQPRDIRPQYPYLPEDEQRWREAYERLQWMALEELNESDG